MSVHSFIYSTNVSRARDRHPAADRAPILEMQGLTLIAKVASDLEILFRCWIKQLSHKRSIEPKFKHRKDLGSSSKKLWLGGAGTFKKI